MAEFETLNIHEIQLEGWRIEENKRIRDKIEREKELRNNPPRTRSWGESNFLRFQENFVVLDEPIPKEKIHDWFIYGF